MSVRLLTTEMATDSRRCPLPSNSSSSPSNLAISDIFGGNAFLLVLFLVATVISGQAVLPSATSADAYLTALALLLTLVYLLGLLFRPRRRILSMGVDSLVVLILYALGVAGLVAIA